MSCFNFNRLSLLIICIFLFFLKNTSKCQSVPYKTVVSYCANATLGQGSLGITHLSHKALSIDITVPQKFSFFGLRLEQSQFEKNRYKGMGSNKLFQLHGIYFYEKKILSSSASFSLKAGLPIMSLGSYKITDVYDPSEFSAPYLPPALQSGWVITGEKTIATYGFWTELGIFHDLNSLSSSNRFLHRIGAHLNHFFYHFEVLSGYMEAHHPNGSYIISDGKQLARKHLWKGNGFTFSYQVSW